MIPLTQLQAPAPYQLWQVDLRIGAEAEKECFEVLAEDERARAARFVFARDRTRYTAAHCALRQILSQWVGEEPGRLEFDLGRFGKPYLRRVPQCSFNLSHSGDTAAVVVSDSGDIGVDLEVRRTIDGADLLAEENYTPAERAAYATTGEAERDLWFLTCWTRKEACLKAVGCGLNIDPRSFECGLETALRLVRLATPKGDTAVEVQSLCTSPGIVISLAHTIK